MRKFLAAALTLLFGAGLVLSACSSKPTPGRVMVLGLDGMDPETIDLMMSEGKLPNFAKLRQDGAYGKLTSQKPLLSPIIWTTIATGKTPDQHQIGHFVAVNEKTGEQLPVTSQMRKAKALWNIASEAGKQVGIVGYWATWPAEAVKGTIVSDHTCYHFLFADGATGATDTAGIISPAALEPVIRPMIRRPGDLKLEDTREFVNVTPEELDRPFSFEDDLSHFKWALATAQTYQKIGLFLWERERPDLSIVYIEGTDSTAHLFGHLFRAQGLAGELAEQQKRYGNAVEQMYLYADRIVGDYMKAMDDNTTLVILSDHGFQLGVLPDDPSKLRDMRRVSEQFHKIDGILYMYGNKVKPRSRIDQATILDITPTVLTLLGISPAQDMPGRVLGEALTVKPPARSVASYETGAQVAAAKGAQDTSVDPKILEHLKALGYLDAQSPKGKRNLAAVHFQNGRYAEAAKAYEELIKEDPNDGALYASLAGTYGVMGRYDDALKMLDKAEQIAPLNPETYHNRGVILERQGKPQEAAKQYATALRYNSDYEPSRAALVRLTGSANVNRPRTDAEKLAATLAERASTEARKGDYQGAMKTLDEAEKIAPRFAMVHQYRSNVAFLMGDRARAIAALETALEIEPDNALFRTNLQRLMEGEGK